MELVDYIVIAILVLAVGGALTYVIVEKKKGKKCIGCPYVDTCSKNKNGDGGCSCGNNVE